MNEQLPPLGNVAHIGADDPALASEMAHVPSARFAGAANRVSSVDTTRSMVRGLWESHEGRVSPPVHRMAEAEARSTRGREVSPVVPEIVRERRSPAVSPEAARAGGSPIVAAEVVRLIRARVELPQPVSALDVAAYCAAVSGCVGPVVFEGGEIVTLGMRVPITTDPTLWRRTTDLGREVLWASSYGAVAADASAGRPLRDVGFAPGDPRRPRQTSRVATVPESMSYDRATQTLNVGTGSWGSVAPAVASYRVGARNVLWSWFAWRTMNAHRGVARTHGGAVAWPDEWSAELHDLLVVLARLAELDTRRVDLVAAIVTGPVGSVGPLRPADRGGLSPVPAVWGWTDLPLPLFPGTTISA